MAICFRTSIFCDCCGKKTWGEVYLSATSVAIPQNGDEPILVNILNSVNISILPRGWGYKMPGRYMTVTSIVCPECTNARPDYFRGYIIF